MRYYWYPQKLSTCGFQAVSSCSNRQFSLPILGSHIANMIGASWRLRPSSWRQSCTDLVHPGASNGARTGPASFVLVASGGMRKGFSHFSGSRNHRNHHSFIIMFSNLLVPWLLLRPFLSQSHQSPANCSDNNLDVYIEAFTARLQPIDRS